MSNKSKGSVQKGKFVTNGASVPTTLKKGATTPVKPKPKPSGK